MFSLHQIKDASGKLKTGADFPAYVQDLLKIGVTEYVTFVTDGHTVFFGEEDFSIQSEDNFEPVEVAEETNREKFVQGLIEHQQGRLDFPGFCHLAAASGVARWMVDTNAKTCTYFNTAGEIVLSEHIPPAK